jgi:drug/metabolite transporter (DMT)-like permease
MTSANILIVLVVGLVVGALTGVVLNGMVGDLSLAIIAGFLAAIIGALARSTIMGSRSGAGPDPSRIPLIVTVYAAVASLGGSSIALEIATHSHDLMSTAVWIGALAGLFSTIILTILLLTYEMKPAEKERPSKKY